MIFLCLLVALLIEHVRPLRERSEIVRAAFASAHWLEAKLNGGREMYGALAWVLFAALPALLAGTFSLGLMSVGLTASWLWQVAVMVLMLGFRGLIAPFGEIEWALLAGDMLRAKRLCRQWFEQDAARFPDNVPASDLARTAIAQLIYSAATRVFSVIFWYLLLGVAGAVLVRLTVVCANIWTHHPENMGDEPFARFAQKANYVLQWPSVRMTALIFALTGHFDAAMQAWRQHAPRWADAHHGIPIESAAGALAIQIDPPNVPMSQTLTGDTLQSVQGLMWRALGVWLLLALLVSAVQAMIV